MEWTYLGRQITAEDLEGKYGFIYEIHNLTNNRIYIGKKFLLHKKTKQVKGKKKKFLIESDWREYYGSNQELKDDVQRLGEENFSRTILSFHDSKGETNYAEAKTLFLKGVLESDRFYNGWISCKCSKSHINKKKKEDGEKQVF